MEHRKSDKIPATVSVLTRNSGATLARALESVKDFAEILVADGGSTDDTLELARAAGARIIPQNKVFQDDDGRLKDWSGARNECLEAASYLWHFYIDSDEYASAELIDEIRSIVEKGKRAVFWVPRKYVFKGVAIERSLGYPNQQIRFFHKEVVTGFRKPIHERVESGGNTSIFKTRSPIFVPADIDIVSARKKMDRYISLELERQSPITYRVFLRMFQNALRACLRYAMRFIRMLFQRGPRLPLTQDMLAFEYEIRLAVEAFRRASSS